MPAAVPGAVPPLASPRHHGAPRTCRLDTNHVSSLSSTVTPSCHRSVRTASAAAKLRLLRARAQPSALARVCPHGVHRENVTAAASGATDASPPHARATHTPPAAHCAPARNTPEKRRIRRPCALPPAPAAPAVCAAVSDELLYVGDVDRRVVALLPAVRVVLGVAEAALGLLDEPRQLPVEHDHAQRTQLVANLVGALQKTHGRWRAARGTGAHRGRTRAGGDRRRPLPHAAGALATRMAAWRRLHRLHVDFRRVVWIALVPPAATAAAAAVAADELAVDEPGEVLVDHGDAELPQLVAHRVGIAPIAIAPVGGALRATRRVW
eukprot:5960150-Prymnesium_polylepis.1